MAAAEAIRVEKLQTKAKAMRKTDKNTKNEKDSKELKTVKKDTKLEITDDANKSNNLKEDEQSFIVNDKKKEIEDGASMDSISLQCITNNFDNNIVSGENHRNYSVSVGEDSSGHLSNGLLLSAHSISSTISPETVLPSSSSSSSSSFSSSLSSSSSASAIVDTKNVPEKRSSRIRVPKKNQSEEHSSIFNTTEAIDSVEEEEEEIIQISDKSEKCNELLEIEKGKNIEGEAEELNLDDDDDENILLSVPIPQELTPNPNPISYLPCVVYSLSAEEAYFSCCLDQVCMYVRSSKKNPIITCNRKYLIFFSSFFCFLFHI